MQPELWLKPLLWRNYNEIKCKHFMKICVLLYLYTLKPHHDYGFINFNWTQCSEKEAVWISMPTCKWPKLKLSLQCILLKDTVKVFQQYYIGQTKTVTALFVDSFMTMLWSTISWKQQFMKSQYLPGLTLFGLDFLLTLKDWQRGEDGLPPPLLT